MRRSYRGLCGAAHQSGNPAAISRGRRRGAITHAYGCGVAIDAPGADIPIRTLRNIGLHANMGGTPLVVSLGCEKLQPARLFPELPVLGADPHVIRMQDERGFGETVSAIMRAAETRMEH